MIDSISYRACSQCGLVHAVDLTRFTANRQMRDTNVTQKCTRCAAVFRSPQDPLAVANRTMALAIGALLLFIPGTLLPLLTIERFGVRHRTSLLQGTWDLLREGNLFVGLVVLVFSIVLPVAKLVGLIELSWWGILRKRHRALLLRIVEFAGRWSMLDVLLLALLVMTVKLGGLVSFHLGPAVFAFVACVVLNMLASMSFDPHLIWESQPIQSASLPNTDPNPPSIMQTNEIPIAIQTSTNDPTKNATQGSSKGPYVSKWWFLTSSCLVAAIAIFWWSLGTRGPAIKIHFRDGYGIKPESFLLHRGIEVGTVTNVELDSKNEGVWVSVQLSSKAGMIATKGSQFWIERAQISTSGVKGLETIVSGRYIAVAPSKFIENPKKAKSLAQYEFVGLDSAPARESDIGSIEIMLESSDRFGLQSDAPVVYRGVEVGRVLSIGLSRDGRWFQARATIDSKYRELVRENSVFWNRSGLRVDLGLTGVAVDADSISTIAAGGVEFATPNEPGPTVKTGRRFEMFRQPESEWTDWRPRLIHGIGTSALADMLATGYPTPLRITLRWQESFFGLWKNKEAIGWILPLDDGTLFGLESLLAVPKQSIAGSVVWEVAGVQANPDSLVLKESSQPEDPKVLWAQATMENLPKEMERWPLARVEGLLPAIGKKPTKSESRDLVIVDGPPGLPIPIEPFLLDQLDPDGQISLSTLGLSESHHGLPVLDQKSGSIVGLIQYDRERSDATILWLP